MTVSVLYVFITYKKGEIAHLKIQLRAAEKGVVVSKPTIEARYDFVLDHDGKLERAQVKYGGNEENSGAVGVDLRKQTRNRGQSRPYTLDKIDALYVYVAPIDKVVRLGPKYFHGKKYISIRWRKAKKPSKQRPNIQKFIW